jgi:cellulose synthase (UDP-forming)
MSFVDFIIRGSFVAFFAIAIYLFVQRWMCHPETERGIHWRGMVLKFACWPVFFMGFVLSIVNADIPYIPTAKKAVRGYFTPFARPLVAHLILFILTVMSVFIYRKYYIPEAELVLSAEKTWGMIAFSFIAVIMSIGGIFAALEANSLKEEDPWDHVDLKKIKV